MEHNDISLPRLQRNIKERDRRIHMRDLLSSLASVLRPQPSKMSMPKLLDEATSQVKQMRARIEELKLRKAQAEGLYDDQNSYMDYHQSATGSSTIMTPVLDIRSGDDSIVEVNLICGSNNNFMLLDIIRVLQEEGAEVVSFSYHNAGDRIINTIKSQAIYPRIGIETQRIRERLNGMVYQNKTSKEK